MAKEYTYDPKTGKWVPSTPTTGTTPSSSSSSSSPSSTNTSSQYPEKVPSSSTGNKPKSKVDSKTKSDKKYIESEFNNTLTGELVVSPSKNNIRINVNDTVEILGIGNYLSGKYFVSSVKRTIDKDSGYSQTITVMKNGFGDSLKKSSEDNKTDKSRSKKVEKSPPTLKVGDTVKIVGNAVYSNASEGVVVPKWVKEKVLTVNKISSDGNRVLLMPIFSWTYVRYVKKV